VILYDYFRSSASYRVRIALALKGLAWDAVPIHLLHGGGEQHGEAFRAINPARAVPVLQLADGTLLTQSLAIIEYLDECHPTPPLLPADAVGRARVRALAQIIASDLHPLNNLRVLTYLGQICGLDADKRRDWYQHWTLAGLEAFEVLLARNGSTGRFCHGDMPTLADCCLVPQLFNARRFECPLDHLPIIGRIATECEALPAFISARPELQPGAD